MSDTVNMTNAVVPVDDMERERAAAETANANASDYADSAGRGYRRLMHGLNAAETLFGVGAVAELRRLVEVVMENHSEARYHASEAIGHLGNVIDAMRQRDASYRRQVGAINATLEGDNARLRDELADASVRADEYAWLRDMLEGTLVHLERSAQRRQVRVPGIVSNIRRGLKVSDARVGIASDAS